MTIKTLIIVPTYNEAGNITLLLDGLNTACPTAHVLFVDDSSQDGTLEEIARHQKSFPERIHLLRRARKLGLGTAYIAGFKWALERDYDAILEMDADLSHSPMDVPRLVATLRDSDVAIGSRYVLGGGTQNWSLFRKAISRFGSFYGRAILGMRVRDLTGGFNGWRRQVLETIALDQIHSEGYSFQIELKYRAHGCGFSIKELPILFVERRFGKSKMSSRIILEAMVRVWVLAFTAHEKPTSLRKLSR